MIDKLNEEYSDLCWTEDEIDDGSSEFVGYKYPNTKELVAISLTANMLEIQIGHGNNKEIFYVSSKDRVTLYKMLSKVMQEGY